MDCQKIYSDWPVCISAVISTRRMSLSFTLLNFWLVLAVFRIWIRLDPHSIWAGIRIRIRNPASDPRIQMSTDRLENPKFTVTDFKDENRKMLRLSWNFNHSFLSLFQELITHGNFLLSRTVKKLSHRMEIFCWLYFITLSHYKSTKTRRKSDFFPIKN